MSIAKSIIRLVLLTLFTAWFTLVTPASAGIGKVICVPWQGDPAKFNTAISGESAQLKAVISTTDTDQIWYKWVYGDGTESAVSSLTGSLKYDVSSAHTYNGAVGTPFTAQLHVDDVDESMANSVTDNYLIKIEQNNLDARVNIAIDKGLWFLYTHPFYHNNLRTFDGSPHMVWNSVSSYYASPTASAVLAFEINNHKENHNLDEDPYVEFVDGGLNWLLNGCNAGQNPCRPTLRAIGISPQTYGDPDTNNNQIGIEVLDWSYRPAYQGGMIMDAIIASGTPEADSGRDFDGDGINETYKDVVQDMIDAYSWGQSDGATAGGGWRYSWNEHPDNSACQWAAIGMIPAEKDWECIVPQWVKDQNGVWLGYSYNGTYKMFGYTSTNWGNDSSIATRPSGMVQMVMSVPEYKNDSRWTGAESWFTNDSNWNWFINRRSYYALYAFVKAMRLSETEILSNGRNWYRASDGVAWKLVNEQEGDGSWPANSHSTHPGGYGNTFVTAWAINMLRPALFSAAPVACFTAEPNPTFPDRLVAFDPSCSTHSETGKDIANLTLFEWDWDNDGTYDESESDPTVVTSTFPCTTLPCAYPVTLRVTDDEGLTATYTLDINITEPPHPPVAGIGGSYIVSLSDLDGLTLDGTSSYELDTGHQAGCDTCPDDAIIAWDWDLTPPLTGFDDASGEIVTIDAGTLASYFTSGVHTIALRVTDNTAAAYPDSGEPNLTDVDFGTLEVYETGLRDLSARPKGTKCQLTWNHIGATVYKIFRSEDGPNTGFSQIGTTTSTYSTFLDYNLASGVGQVVNTCKGDFDNNEIVDESDAAIFAADLGRAGCDQGGEPCEGDFDDDGDVDGGDAAFFSAEVGRVDCLQTTGIELNMDYWYRVMAEINGESILSSPVYINSQGRITNLPPVINSLPVASAQDGVSYSYDVEASDPEGEAITYQLDLAPDGMEIDSNTGLIIWTPEISQLGVIDIMVRVTDASGVSAAQFFQVFVGTGPNAAPAVNAGGPYTGLVGETINFDGSLTSDPDAGDTLVNFHWIFGDGTDAYGEFVSHAYSATGVYSVSLHVTDNRGRTGHGSTICEIGNPDRPPISVLSGPLAADAGTQITFDGGSSYDPDEDTLSYNWDFGEGSTASGETAAHTYADEGQYTVTLTVSDGRGGSDASQISVSVGPPNQLPQFGAPAINIAGDLLNTIELTFATGAGDADSDPLEYTWDFGDGILKTGQVVTHSYELPGEYSVSVVVIDGRGGSDFATQNISIAQVPNRPPVAEAGGPYEGDLAGNPSVNVVLTGIGSSDPDDNIISYTWTYDGQNYIGQTVQIEFDTVGQYEVSLTVEDADGENDTDTTIVNIRDSSDTNPPVALITTPNSETGAVTEKIDVIGTVTDGEHLAGWVLEISVDQVNWKTLSEGTDPVSDGLLGTLDPSLLRNDFYRLRLRARDGNQETSFWVDLQVAGELKFGNLKMTFRDLEIPVAGIPITISRTYDSFKKENGDFGVAWTLDINNAEIKEDVNHNVFVSLPDGRRVSFGFAPVRLSPWFPGWDARFIAPPGVHDELDFAGDHFVNPSGDDWFWFSGVFNPDDYILKTKDGRTYEINQQEGIKKVTDRNGNALTIDENGITHSSGKSIVFTRDSEGRISRISDPAGNNIDYAYDANGDLISVTYPEGYVMTFEYNDNHYITKMIDPEGRAVQQNEYDENGRLISTTNDEGSTVTFVHDVDTRKEQATDAMGNVSQAKFNAKGIKTEEIDQLGNKKLWAYDENQNVKTYEVRDSGGSVLASMSFDYDERGNPLTIGLPDATSFEFTYNEAGKWTSMTMPDGRMMGFGYDVKYNLEHITDTLGQQMTFTYDSLGNRTSVTDALGRTTQYAYDAYGNMTGVTDPCGGVHVYVRDDFGNVLNYTRPDGATFVSAYDSMGRLVTVTDPLGNSRSYEYDGRGNRTAVVDEMGYRTAYSFNSRDKLTKVVYPDGVELVSRYDSNGNMTEVRDPKGNVWRYEYDAANRRIAKIDPTGNRYTFDYDGAGFVSALTDPLGNRTEYERDGFGRVIQATDPNGGVTTYSYDLAGNVTQMTDTLGRNRTWEYDALYRMVSEILPGGQTTRYVYDAAGRRVQRTDAAGNITNYSYDTCDRLTGVTYPDGTTIARTYDNLGNRISMTDQTGTTNYVYDLLNRLTSTTSPGGATVSYSYDAKGNEVSVTDPAGSTSKTYDAMNRLLSVTDRQGGTTSYGYAPSGNLVSAAFPNGVAASYTWDAVNRITDIRFQKPGTLDMEIDYTYDAAGNVIQKMIGADQTVFTYDALDRITGEVEPGRNLQYTYDGVGNRLSTTLNGSTTPYSYNANDEELGLPVFDANGNLTSDGVRSYTYDFENRLTAVYEAGVPVAEYSYDGDGNRVSATAGGITTSFLHDINRNLPVVLLEDRGGATQAAYTYGNGRISMDRQGAFSYYMSDALQSVVGLAGETGSLTDSYAYDAFGSTLSAVGATINPYRFTGESLDQNTGLYDLRARSYDPRMGRFLSRDPAMGDIPRPMTFHPYIYGMDNPLKYVDPSGRQAIMTYAVTVLNNPLQWMGAFVGGVGAGYTSTTLGFLTEVMANVGKPMMEIFAKAVMGAFVQFNLLDCGQLAISAGVKNGGLGALAQLAHKLTYYVGQNSATGDWSNSGAQLRDAMAGFAENIGRLLVQIPHMIGIGAGGEIIEHGVSGTVFLMFDIGKTAGGILAMMNIARAAGFFM